MRIVIAPDAFKGSLDADRVATAIAEGIPGALPAAAMVLRPVADGGEGTVAVLLVTCPDGRGGERALAPRPPGEDPARMTESGRPLVLVDVRPTDCGYRALLWALREAERRDAILLAVTVWPGDPAQPDDGRAEMEQALTGMVERAVEESGVHGRTQVAALTYPVTVAEVAVRTGAELLVMGTEPVPAG